MPIEPIYVGDALLQNRTTRGCPKSTDISGLNIFGVPIVYDLSLHEIKNCSSGDFNKDANLSNTNGCCVVDNSGEYCTDYTNEKNSSNMYYDMGVVYFDSTAPPEDGQRKICYTTPIRKRRVKYMEIIYDIFVYSFFLILIAIQGACYEYWMINGECHTDDIATTLTAIPYSINKYPNKSDNISRPSTSEHCKKPEKINDKEIDWYSTFPYNLITYINEPDKKNHPFDPRELVKIPIRGFLLGFFYCIIISRILMKGMLSVLSDKYYNLIESKKNNNILKGLIFVLVFMGLYGNIAYLAGYDVPGMNATASVLLGVFGFIAIWIGGIFGLICTMVTFLGYRKDLKKKYKEHLDDPGKPELDYLEKCIYYCGSLWIVDKFFRFKKTIAWDDKEDTRIDLDKIDNIADKDLDWFFPIRLDELKVELPSFLNIDLTKHIEAIRNNWGEEPPECDPKYYAWRWVCNSWDGKNYEWNTSPFMGRDGSTYKPKEVKEKESEDRIKKADGKDYTRKVLGYAMNAAIREQESNPCGDWTRLWLGVFLAAPVRLACLIIYVGVVLSIWLSGLVLKCLWFFIVFYLVVTFVTCGLFGNMIAFFYLHLYTIIGFFYTPLSHYYELFEIIKSHGNILTLLFCAIVVQSGVKVLDPISSGVIGGLFAILVVYKLIVSLNT